MNSDKRLLLLSKMYEMMEEDTENSTNILETFKELVFNQEFDDLEEDSCFTDGIYDPDKDPYWGG